MPRGHACMHPQKTARGFLFSTKRLTLLLPICLFIYAKSILVLIGGVCDRITSSFGEVHILNPVVRAFIIHSSGNSRGVFKWPDGAPPTPIKVMSLIFMQEA